MSAEPLSEDELAGIGRVCSEPSEGAAAELRDIIARLLATIRARDEEIARLRRCLEERTKTMGDAQRRAEKAWIAEREASTLLADECNNGEAREAALRTERDKAREQARRLREAFGMDDPWPLESVLRKLADAADHLFSAHDCDTHGWEEIDTARKRAREILSMLSAPEAGR